MLKYIHTHFAKISAVTTALLSLFLCSACDSKDDGLMADLTEGYWRSESPQLSPDFMINFSDTGQVFCYVFAPSGNGGYDAYYDSSFTEFYKYAVDISNKRLCFLPDRWFDILVLNKNVLTLGADDGDGLKFSKIGFDEVEILSPEQFLELHPSSQQNF